MLAPVLRLARAILFSSTIISLAITASFFRKASAALSSVPTLVAIAASIAQVARAVSGRRPIPAEAAVEIGA